MEGRKTTTDMQSEEFVLQSRRFRGTTAHPLKSNGEEREGVALYTRCRAGNNVAVTEELPGR